MSNKINVGVVFSSRFKTGTNRKFSSYINYMDRESAIRTHHFSEYNMVDYDGYNNYMSNPEKSSGLFSSQKDNLSKNEITHLKEQFKIAQKNDSVMWQDVVSFDNRWLEKYGMYNESTGVLNEKAIMQAVRESVKDILEKEGMSNSAVWSGAIHYNTQHIHVHLAIVEPKPTRPYKIFTNKKTGEQYQARAGYRKEPNIKNFRSKIANRIVNREQELTKISSLVRNSIGNREIKFRKLPDKILQKQYSRIFNKLPDDKRLWKYNMNSMKELRPLIDEFSTTYINLYHKEDMQKLISALDKQTELNQEIYGTGTKEIGRYQDTTSNKLDELYTRLGNTLLSDMKSYDFSLNNEKTSLLNQSPTAGKASKGISRGRLNQLKKAFSKDFDHVKNQRKYKELQQSIEQEQGRE